MEEYIKFRIAEFWRRHPDFDDRNPKHIREAEALLHELSHEFPRATILEAIEDLRREAEKELETAREKFYTAIEKANRGEYDDNVPVPGTTGELVGSSQKGRGGDLLPSLTQGASNVEACEVGRSPQSFTL